MRRGLPVLVGSLALVAGIVVCSSPRREKQPAVRTDPRIAVDTLDPASAFDHDLESALTAHRQLRFAGDLDDILARGVLRVVTADAAGYFLRKGELGGPHYELGKWLAEEIGVRVDVVVAVDPATALEDGRADVAIDDETFITREADVGLRAFVDAFVERAHNSETWNVHTLARTDDARQLSRFDALFKAAAGNTGLDWRLLAAMAFEESRFDADVVSPNGAVGVMQFLPETAMELGCKDPSDPKRAIPAAARYVVKLMRQIDPSEALPVKERVRFALAAYNGGLTRLEDARTLAMTQGLDPDRWFENVERAFRVAEPVGYVDDIQARYEAYVTLVER